MKVFISHSEEDIEIANRIYNDLTEKGVSPWIDDKDIVVGENREFAIKNAIKGSDYFITIISKHSVSERGFVQKEQKIALDMLDEFPNGEIFIIPVRIDDAEPRDEKLQNLHWADFSTSYEKGAKQIFRTLKIDSPPKPRFPKSILAIIAAVLILIVVAVILLFSGIPKPDISGKWKYHVPPKIEKYQTWLISQNGDTAKIEEKGRELRCEGKIQADKFSFSCTEPMTGGAPSVKFEGEGRIEPNRKLIKGEWTRQGLSGSFVLEKTEE